MVELATKSTSTGHNFTLHPRFSASAALLDMPQLFPFISLLDILLSWDCQFHDKDTMVGVKPEDQGWRGFSPRFQVGRLFSGLGRYALAEGRK